ncbi:hypothetical protein Q7C36_022644 [Tachysurus vachellii]|uniref:Uncharacterized protein n=1 Tax=Tachysurus vachellii TaxID=175792 RepID=A0AA88LNN7_TACVA|nr:hypothetical protein Q7C36_022644 [Tachysurus vachellii]
MSQSFNATWRAANSTSSVKNRGNREYVAIMANLLDPVLSLDLLSFCMFSLRPCCFKRIRKVLFLLTALAYQMSVHDEKRGAESPFSKGWETLQCQRCSHTHLAFCWRSKLLW